MSEQRTSEELTTNQSTHESPSVMGGGSHPAPMPTEADYRRAHKAEYVRLFVDVGVPEDVAAGWHDEEWEDIKGETPQQAFDDEVQYWENDGG